MTGASYPDRATGDARLRWLGLLPVPLRRRLEGLGAAQAAIANSGWLMFDRLVRALVGLLVGAWVARYLGPASFGVLAYVLACVAMFHAFATLGADSIVVRDLAQRPDEAAQILGSAIVLRTVMGGLCWVAAVVWSAVASRGDRQIVMLTAIVASMLAFQAADVVDLWFQSQSQSRRTVVAKLVTYLLTSGIKVVLIVRGAPLEAFAWVAAFDALAAAGALLVAYRRFKTAQRWQVLRHTVVALLREAWPFMLSGFAIAVYLRVDQLVVKEVLGPRELGVYAAVLPISQFWQIIPLTAAVSLAPYVARMKIRDDGSYTRTLVLAFRAFFYAGVVSAVITLAISGWLVQRLFGAQYAEGATVLAVHSISNIFCFLGVAHGLWLTNERRFAVRLYGTVAAGLTALGLNFVLLPRVGLVGAACAAIAAQFVAAFLVNLFLDPRSFRLQCDAILFRKA